MIPRPDHPPRTSPALLRALAASVASSVLIAASQACHAAGRKLNHWQWRIDGIPGPTTRNRAVANPARVRATVPSGYATGRADLQFTHGDGPVASPPGHQPPCTSPTHSHWKDTR